MVPTRINETSVFEKNKTMRQLQHHTVTVTVTVWRSTQLIRAMASRSVTARFLQIRLNGYKREENVASQPVREVVHTPLQHKQSSPQLQLLGATG